MDDSSYKNSKKKFWLDFWPTLQQATRETDNHIDKKVYGIAAGGIGLEMASIQFLNDTCFKWLAITSAILFSFTLMINLGSHVWSLKSQQKERDAITDFISQEDSIDDQHIYDLIRKENKIITIINNCSILLMIAGILSFLIYLFLNFK